MTSITVDDDHARPPSRGLGIHYDSPHDDSTGWVTRIYTTDGNISSTSYDLDPARAMAFGDEEEAERMVEAILAHLGANLSRITPVIRRIPHTR